MATVSKNIVWSSATSLLQVYTGSIVFIALAKLMSVEDFGILSFGFSLSTILWVCSDFGLSLMIMKDYPKNTFDTQKYLFNGLLFKLFISILVGLVSLSYLNVFYEDKWVIVGGLYTLFAIVSSFIIYFQSLLKIQNKFHKFTETTVVYAIGITITILLYWATESSLIQLASYLLMCKVSQLLWCIYICRSSFESWSYDQKMQHYFLKNSWSFGLHTILGILYFMLDTQIISIYLGAEEVALYQAVFRIILIFLMLSELLSNVLLPYLSFKYANHENIDDLVSKILLYLLIIGCSIFLFTTTFRSLIMEILYTKDYVSAIPLLVPLSIVIIIRTICSLLGNILTISNKQIYRVSTVFITLIVSAVLNLVFIPQYGILAASWISVLAHLVLFVLYYYFSRQVIPNIALFSGHTIAVILATIGLYFSLAHFSNLGHYPAILGIVIWLGFIVLIMRSGNNFEFLKQILKDKGAG